MPDIARAAVMLLDAPDEDFGQAWNMPCAPTRSPRALLAMGAAALGHRLRVWAVPFALLRPLGLVYRFAKEVADVGFTWDRPYIVDGGRFIRRFGFTPTPFEIGVPATAHAFAKARRHIADPKTWYSAGWRHQPTTSARSMTSRRADSDRRSA